MIAEFIELSNIFYCIAEIQIAAAINHCIRVCKSSINITNGYIILGRVDSKISL